MTQNDELLDPENWERSDRGRSWFFTIDTPHLVSALEEVADARSDKLELLACWRSPDGDRRSRSVYQPMPLSDLPGSLTWEYFVRSSRLTESLPPPAPLMGVGWPRWFSLNGLVHLAHPYPGRFEAARSRLAQVPRIHSKGSAEHVEFEEYSRLYSEIRAAIIHNGGRQLR
jgi:hypothetical protein